jgi:hypothetical protein
MWRADREENDEKQSHTVLNAANRGRPRITTHWSAERSGRVTRSMMRLACGVWSKRQYNAIDVEELGDIRWTSCFLPDNEQSSGTGKDESMSGSLSLGARDLAGRVH